jgi:hypothetical protein
MATISSRFTTRANRNEGTPWSGSGNLAQDESLVSTLNTTSKMSSTSTISFANVLNGFLYRSNVRIIGLSVTLTHRSSSLESTVDSLVRLSLDGVQIGNNLSNSNYWPTRDTEVTYGGPTDLWGLTQTQVDSLTSGKNIKPVLGVEIKPSQGLNECYLSYVKLQVYYRIEEVFTFKNGSWVKVIPNIFKNEAFSNLPEIKVNHNNEIHVVYLD